MERPNRSPSVHFATTFAASFARAFLALAIMAAIVIAGSGHLPPAAADESDALTVTPPYANDDTTISVTVDDSGLGTTELHQDEDTDFTGNPYSLQPGATGQQEVFRVKKGPIADLNRDGKIDAGDLEVALDGNDIGLSWLNTQNGTFAVHRFVANSVEIPFSVTYRNEKLDTAVVDIRSTADPDGLSIVVQETGLATNIFTATFGTGTETTTTNALLPGATPRPTIKVVNGGVVTVEYADAQPPTLASEAVVIDTVKPLLTIVQPEHGLITSNAQTWASIDVTDDRSGIELTDIEFFVDLNADGDFDDAGELVLPDPDVSTQINNGWAAFGLFSIPEDGNVSWYATVVDRAGNVTRSDSSTDTGFQNHSYTIDTKPPAVSSVILGGYYDEAKERELTNRPGQVRVDFDEEIDPESIVPGRFLFGSLVPVFAAWYEDLPESVFLTYENLPSISKPMLILSGGVKDLRGVNSEVVSVPVEDKLGPILEVIFSTVITNNKVSVTTRSPEELAAPPTIEINGVTFGAMTRTSAIDWEWSIDVHAPLLTGSAAGDGVKNVEIAGFDPAGNRAHGGVSREDPAWPSGAHLYELDRQIKKPVILPAANDIATVENPVITASYATEGDEYAGDTHQSVTIVVAKLDGFDVTSQMQATTATSWSFQPGALASGAHDFVIQGRDDAGNVHGASTLVFTVDAPATPTPEPTATPEPTEPPVPVESPGATPPPELVGTATPVPVEPTPTPEPAPTAEATTVPLDGEETPTPTPEPVSQGTPEPTPDLEATVQAIRSGDGSNIDGETPVEAEGSTNFTLYGCGLPVGSAGVAGGDYLVTGIGLVGLVVLARRRKRSGDGEQHE